MELYLIIQFNNNSSDIFLMTSLKLLIMKMNHSDESVLIILLVYIRAYLQIDNYVTKNDRTANSTSQCINVVIWVAIQVLVIRNNFK